MLPLANTALLQFAPLRRAERDRDGRIIGLERAGSQREPTSKGSDCKDHWLLDPLGGSPFLTYLGLQSREAIWTLDREVPNATAIPRLWRRLRQRRPIQ